MRPITGASSFDLTEEQRKTFAKQAEGGDAQAAMALYRYFEFRAVDGEKALAWLQMAAKNGSVEAEYTLGLRLAGLGRQNARYREGRNWLKKAAESGHEGAVSALKDYPE